MCAVCIFDYMVITVTSREWSCVPDFHFFLYILLFINPSFFFFYSEHALLLLFKFFNLKIKIKRDFLGGPVPKTPLLQYKGPGFHPWSGN